MAPKPILKNRENPNELQELSKSETVEERHRRIARFHAHRLQTQKDIENQVFEAIEALLDFPMDDRGSSSTPAEADINMFQELIKPFQVSDYDSLLDERRMADKCGYVFCSNAPKKQDTRAKYRILGLRKGQEFKIVETRSLELWCSPECARRALYIKVQLLEEPAWLRRGGAAPSVTLLMGDDNAVAIKEQTRNMDDDQLRKAMEDLALERGDKKHESKPETLVNSEVVEKTPTIPPRFPKSDKTNSIEGYEPRSTAIGFMLPSSHPLSTNVVNARGT